MTFSCTRFLHFLQVLGQGGQMLSAETCKSFGSQRGGGGKRERHELIAIVMQENHYITRQYHDILFFIFH